MQLCFHHLQYLAETQKMLLRAAFLLPKTLTREQERAVHAFGNAFQDDTKGWSRTMPH